MNPIFTFASRVNDIVRLWNIEDLSGEQAMHAIVYAMEQYVKESDE